MSVIAPSAVSPSGTIEMAVGLFGFYLQLGAMTVANAVSYPIRTNGPATLDVVLGTLGLAFALVLAVAPRLGRWRPPPLLRASAAIWLVGWFPASRLVLPLREVLAADRFLLFPTLGLALVAALGLVALRSRRARIALASVVVVAASLRTLDAQRTWRSGLSLWERAVRSNPDDGDAWAGLVGELDIAGRPDLASEVLYVALQRMHSRRLIFWDALLAVEGHERARGIRRMRDAALAGDQYAMNDLAQLLAEDGERGQAFVWAWLAVVTGPPRDDIDKTYRALAPPADRD
jgi:hypothetical protein